MPSIQYEEVDVSEKSLKQRQALFDAAPIEKKMGLWYAKRHYSQLDRERKQGYHHLYLSGPGAIHCTCGLVVKKECSSFELKKDSLAAHLFVKEHNRKCGSSLRRKRSRQKKVG